MTGDPTAAAPPGPADADAKDVRAAGCVVWRSGPSGALELLVVHRPRYDDWSLPKGKLDPGETDRDCALREVREETGLSGPLGPELPSTRYRDRKGRSKVVRYWSMECTGGTFQPNDEVDDIRWLGPSEALDRLSYARDRPVVEAFLASTTTGPAA